MIRKPQAGVGLLFIAGLIGLPTAAALQDDDIAMARQALKEMVDNNAAYYEERSQWTLDKEVLLDSIDLREREIEEVRSKTEEARGKIGQAAKDLDDLRRLNDQLTGTADLMESRIDELEAAVRSMVPGFPAPLLDSIEPLVLRLPAEGEEALRPISERYQAVVGILNAANKFNRDVHVSPELRDLGDGTSAEVTILYFGLAQAYYVNKSGDAAGLGVATAEGWQWTPADEHAQAIALAIAVQKNEKPAEFVPLPFTAPSLAD